jgi:hypothetical protein
MGVCAKFMGPKEISTVGSFLFSTGSIVDSFHCTRLLNS